MTHEETKLLYEDWIRGAVKREGPDFRDVWTEMVRAERKDIIDNPEIGWELVMRMTNAPRISPLVERPAYKWVRHGLAIWENRECHRGNSPEMLVMMTALGWRYIPIEKLVLRAALLTRNATVESVAAALQLEPMFVEAYEALFFNVLDRRDDPAYMLKTVKCCVPRQGYEDEPDYHPDWVWKEGKELFDTAMHGTLEDVMALIPLFGCEPVVSEWPSWGGYNPSVSVALAA